MHEIIMSPIWIIIGAILFGLAVGTAAWFATHDSEGEGVEVDADPPQTRLETRVPYK